ncbi:hypothetical protein GCM10009865_06860 [Aeromicrobium ponti]|uniref:Uncharacterized protein n=1 Tax=Cytobacillus oceanisediminis TaxID=665099 RepID=A0A562K7C1_9BACI|nr:hypothetical protein [Cytobacillus oceanisediminis]TWH91134.1 hypothetical protein IQ19_00587 [Cytobacillus oceanisediminis]
MGFVLLVFLAWLITVLYTVINKKLTFIENTFVYLFTLVININFTWIVYEELKLAEISDRALDYTAFLIHRSITLPLVIVIAINLYRNANTLGSKVVRTALSVLFLVFAVAIARYFDILEYKNWSILSEIVYLLLLHFLAIYSLKYFENIKTRGVRGS